MSIASSAVVAPLAVLCWALRIHVIAPHYQLALLHKGLGDQPPRHGGSSGRHLANIIQKKTHYDIYIYIYIYIYMYVLIMVIMIQTVYIYIYREREREVS